MEYYLYYIQYIYIFVTFHAHARTHARTHTDLHAPHTGGVVEGGVKFPCPAGVPEVSNIPNINTVVVVDTGQPAVGGVIGHRHRVRVSSLQPAGEQLTGGGALMSQNKNLTDTGPNRCVSSQVCVCVTWRQPYWRCQRPGGVGGAACRGSAG